MVHDHVHHLDHTSHVHAASATITSTLLTGLMERQDPGGELTASTKAIPLALLQLKWLVGVLVSMIEMGSTVYMNDRSLCVQTKLGHV